MMIYREVLVFVVVLVCLKDLVVARRCKDKDTVKEPVKVKTKTQSQKKRRNQPCADNQVCSHMERMYTPFGEVTDEKLVRNFCRCGGGRNRIRCMNEWDEYGDQAVYFMLPGDWSTGVQIRQAGLCDDNYSKPSCDRGQKAATYRLYTTNYVEEIEVHCTCNNPLAPLLPMNHTKSKKMLYAEFKCNEFHRPPGDEAPWWGDKLYTGRR